MNNTYYELIISGKKERLLQLYIRLQDCLGKSNEITTERLGPKVISIYNINGTTGILTRTQDNDSTFVRLGLAGIDNHPLMDRIEKAHILFKDLNIQKNP